jgi:uncharacterized membrane protein YdbT with pleckstrin-like domain
MGLLSNISSPNIRRHLLRDEGEVVVDEVRKHWVMYIVPVLECLAGVAILVVVPFVLLDLAWLPLILGIVVLSHGLWKYLEARLDRFVITNMRVFRLNGVFTQHLATMPLLRILDILVEKPWIGRVLGYGHFVFESAAQDQGLREIRFVGKVDERDLTIQRVVQRAGLRGSTSKPV